MRRKAPNSPMVLLSLLALLAGAGSWAWASLTPLGWMVLGLVVSWLVIIAFFWAGENR